MFLHFLREGLVNVRAARCSSRQPSAHARGGLVKLRFKVSMDDRKIGYSDCSTEYPIALLRWRDRSFHRSRVSCVKRPALEHSSSAESSDTRSRAHRENLRDARTTLLHRVTNIRRVSVPEYSEEIHVLLVFVTRCVHSIENYSTIMHDDESSTNLQILSSIFSTLSDPRAKCFLIQWL